MFPLSPSLDLSPLPLFLFETGLPCLRRKLVHRTPSSKTGENLREEKNLDRNSQPRVQRHNQDQQDLACLGIRRIEHGVEVPKKEKHSPDKTNTNQRPVERGQRAPTDKRNGNPDQVRVPIQSPALDQISRRAPEPAQSPPQRNRQDTRVSIDQARRPGKQREVVLEVLVVIVGQPLRDGPRQEQNHHHRSRDPHGPVQVRVSFQDVQEVGARVQRRHTTAQHLVRVDVEESLVVVQRPPAVLRRRPAG